jgi:HlyD family secretion protein
MTLSRRMMVAVVVLVALVAAAVVLLRGRKGEVRYQTAAVDKGDIQETVGATGALQAVVTVQVGSQVSGSIQEMHADFNSMVKKGQLIARLDPSTFAARVAQAQANLTAARANVERSRAAVEDAQQKYERAKALSAQDLLPATDLETARTNYESAKASVEGAQAAVAQAAASVKQAAVDLEHTAIYAPIDGVVIARNVDVGQTVAASLQAPTLFVIANDLTQMQVNASIDEADVGRVHTGQDATFRVDAYPERTFRGQVSQVRLQPTTNQNVVTYSTIVNVPNPDSLLMPGMTASVSIIVERREGALRVPAAALRFRPPGAGGGERDRGRAGGGGGGAATGGNISGGPGGGAGAAGAGGSIGAGGEGGGRRRSGGDNASGRGSGGAGGGADAAAEGGRSGRGGGDGGATSREGRGRPATVYVLAPNGPEPKKVRVGVSDGQFVEVKDGLAEGDSVITGVEGEGGASPAARPGQPSPGGGSNPFNPQFQRRQR